MPGKRVKLTWDQIGKGLGLDYEPNEHGLLDQAYEESKSFVKEYEENEDLELTDEQVEIANMMITDALFDHWSVWNVYRKNIDVGEIIESINEWSNRGMQSVIYEDRDLPAGDGIVNYTETDEGVSFELDEPFIVAYVEAAYCVLGIGDEGYTLFEITKSDVLKVARWIAECEGDGQRFSLDLENWDNARTGPSYWEVAEEIEKVKV